MTDNVLQAADRLRDLQRHGAERPAAARRGVGPRHLGPLQRQPERGVAGRSTSRRWPATYGTYSQESHGILFNISARPRNGLVFQGGVSTGRHAHRLLRGPGGAARAERWPRMIADQPVVRHDHRLGDSLHRPRVIHRSEGRRAGVGHVPQRPGRAAGGQHGVHRRADDARPRRSSTTRRT